ncbi:acetate--CoA ligase family protein (plasmid) [Halobaculum sp. CBA1158]|uniref:acetate--CoA ligase family protein n=1 Tax=Halobaculum sp. CBA1158 TaxID=2904243 RepID=UPI001F18575B|nr:acetate--CoA ligase family protein [Halobaculum sp. CBA1158]UIP01482.1 acetate--CoA ligase family protein [Halobaculum sp. CBA1158]
MTPVDDADDADDTDADDTDADDANPVAAALADGRTTLTEAESKTLLRGAGVETTDFVIADDADGAVAAAEEIGYPVVLKVSSPAVTHKSEWGSGAGVAVGLDSAEAVRSAAERIETEAEAAGVDARLLVEELADTDAGTEVIVGGLRDPSFGPVVLAGLGGVFTEVFEDTSHRLAPVDRAEAREAVESLTAARLLAGYRGSEPADLDALADVVVAVGDLLIEHEAIVEVDVNPVLATGEGAVALDALVVLDDDRTEGGE